MLCGYKGSVNQEDGLIRGQGTKKAVWEHLHCEEGLPLQESGWGWGSSSPPTSPFGSQEGEKNRCFPSIPWTHVSATLDSAFEAGGQSGVQALGILTRPGCGGILPLINLSKFTVGTGAFKRMTGSPNLYV